MCVAHAMVVRLHCLSAFTASDFHDVGALSPQCGCLHCLSAFTAFDFPPGKRELALERSRLSPLPFGVHRVTSD